MDLSTHRADAVRDVLVNQLKVPANRLQAKGYGLTRPVSEPGSGSLARARSERVASASVDYEPRLLPSLPSPRASRASPASSVRPRSRARSSAGVSPEAAAINSSRHT
jgi:OmpA family